MNGKILVGDHNGVYVIRFEGDVRVTLSASFDRYLDAILNNENLQSVLIDLSAASAIDSTSLGVLARLSLAVKKQRNQVPTLVCNSVDILRILNNMGFDDIFVMVSHCETLENSLAELPVSADLDEAALRDRVIEAHKVLMALNEENHNTFKDLVSALEAEQNALPPSSVQSG